MRFEFEVGGDFLLGVVIIGFIFTGFAILILGSICDILPRFLSGGFRRPATRNE
jgi:hypothetical protein